MIIIIKDVICLWHLQTHTQPFRQSSVVNCPRHETTKQELLINVEKSLISLIENQMAFFMPMHGITVCVCVCDEQCTLKRILRNAASESNGFYRLRRYNCMYAGCHVQSTVLTLFNILYKISLLNVCLAIYA